MSSKSGKKILRIGLIQDGKIVDECLMRSANTVRIGRGAKKNDLVVPASDLPKSYKVFRPDGDAYRLHFTEQMSGRVSRGGGVQSLQELIDQGDASRSGGDYVVSLNQKSRGKVSVGEVTLLFQFVTPPPPKPKPVLPAAMRGGWFKGVEPYLLAVLVISAILQGGFVGWVQSQDWPEQLDAVDRDIPDRFVKIMAEKEPDEPEIPDKKETSDDNDESEESDKKKKAEKKKEEKPKKAENKKKEKKKDKPKSAEQRAKEEAERRKRMAAKVRKSTILNQIGAVSDKDGNLADSLAEGAGNTDMKSAFENSDGVKSGVLGAEKSGLRTSGSSDAEGTGSAAGIDDLGATSGAKAAEDGVDTGAKKETTVKAKVDIKGGGKQVGTGKLDSGRISSVVRRGASAIQRCFERELKKNPNAGGKLVVTVTVGRAGRVTKVVANTGVGGGFSSCAKRAIKRWRFPRPKGGDVMFSNTFVLQSSN